ncbi:PAS domain-containing sensor histidine kinase [Petroclostridium sp. X23]|uniref:PAS domain-containing sensor histidine kinase n=1 Tax=Petroclostridium sp. X23 TaxID=3045146 RepID=UPI0024AD0B6F|nr:PAS domain-containing sensor histidine kinase [Petroclostridium sp. X23]WHH60086.1 PAS domain-containing sensor histidine kinase [Petroclostridium sp. X23]
MLKEKELKSLKSNKGSEKNNLEEQLSYFSEESIIAQAYDAVGEYVFIINNSREIVYANKILLRMLGIAHLSELIGRSPGDLLLCIDDSDTECGKSENCKECRLNKFLMGHEIEAQENIMYINKNGYRDKIIISQHVSSIVLGDNNYFVISFTDKSDTIKKKFLERVFFHDILNTAGALKGIIQLLKEDVPEKVRIEVEFVENSFKALIDEIQMQKQIIDAENEELLPDISTVYSIEVLNDVYRLFQKPMLCLGKKVEVDNRSVNILFDSDVTILKRILCNMLKNALEAADKGEVIRIGCKVVQEKDSFLEYWVHNDTVIPKNVQKNIFQYSFSTKSDRRGWGTYSMKLLGEKYLKGTVGFISTPEKGTTFHIRIPLKT